MSVVVDYLSRAFNIIQSALSAYREFELQIWNWFLNGFYNHLPTAEGKLDEDLEETLKNSLLYVGVRFRAFNESFGNLVHSALYLTILLFVPTIIWVVLTTTIPDLVPNIIVLSLIFIFGVLLLFSTVALICANLIFFLYMGAIFKFGLQQVRANLASVSKNGFESYQCDQAGEPISVYTTSFSSYIRMWIYGLVLLVIIFSWLISPQLLKVSATLAELVPIEDIPGTFVISFIVGVFEGVNALIHVDLTYFTSPSGIQSLTVLIIGLLVFSIFLNGKNILQLSQLSRFDWSELDEFYAKKELDRCSNVAKISMYNLIQGGMEAEFREIRGEIIQSALWLVVATILSGFHLVLYANSI